MNHAPASRRNPMKSFSLRSASSPLSFLLIALTGAASIAKGQNALVDLPTAPTGFSRASAIYGAPKEQVTDGFQIVTTLSNTYDSNVTQGSGSNGRDKEDDFILGPGAGVSYITQGHEWIAGANFTASYDEYIDHSDFSGLNHSASAFGGYRGGKVIATLRASVSTDRGANRFYNSFVEETRYQYSLVARYKLSPKTSIVGNLSQSYAETDSNAFNDSSSFNAGLSALWSATPLLDLGPGIRYTLRSNDSRDDRTTVGPNFNLNYQLTTKVSLKSRLGVDFISRGNQSSNASFSSSIGLLYQASELWGLNFSFFRDSQGDGATGGFNEVSSTRLQYIRNVRRTTLRLGVGYELNEPDGSGTSATNDYGYLTLDSSLTFPILAERANLTLSIRYKDFDSDANSDFSWSGLQTGLGLSATF